MRDHSLVAIVPGHGPDEQGARNEAIGVSEWPSTWHLAEAIKNASDGSGVSCTIVLRPKAGLSALVKQLNNLSPDAVLSLHFNAAPDAEARDHGYSITHPDAADAAIGLSHHVTATVPSPAGTRVHPRKRGDLAILRDTRMPAVLDEPCYIDSTQRYKTAVQNMGALAHGYVKALELWAVRWGAV